MRNESKKKVCVKLFFLQEKKRKHVRVRDVINIILVSFF